ncbi:MAG: TerB family tellurite resistance protein [Gammaproteobacteria bacterium]|nr:TerB family tellurite resistance protein [Gammaproteobacteria bacterium]
MTDKPIEPRFEGSTLVIETGGETETYDSQFLVAVLLVCVAKGDGTISEKETEKMLELVGDHFHLESAESLALIMRAMSNLAENPYLNDILRQLSTILHDQEKEDVAIMLLKVVAADGKADADEMAMVGTAGEIIDITPDIMHRAFDRYFAETWVD